MFVPDPSSAQFVLTGRTNASTYKKLNQTKMNLISFVESREFLPPLAEKFPLFTFLLRDFFVAFTLSFPRALLLVRDLLLSSETAKGNSPLSLCILTQPMGIIRKVYEFSPSEMNVLFC